MIEVRDLTKRYGPRLAVDRLHFDIRPGRVTGFLGPTGAGKSTTMRLILGLDRPTSGHTSVLGQPYHRLRWPLRQVGALLDARSVHGGRTVYHHLLYLARSNAIPRSRVDELLDLVGLTAAAGTRARALSLGMAQRLGIAAALLGELTADHLIVIGRGRLIADTSVRTFTETNSTGYTLVRAARPDQLNSLLRGAGAQVRPDPSGAWRVSGIDTTEISQIAQDHRIPLHELSPRHPSLEDVYTRMTGATAEYHTPVSGQSEE